jgi:hypothetical protein
MQLRVKLKFYTHSSGASLQLLATMHARQKYLLLSLVRSYACLVVEDLVIIQCSKVLCEKFAIYQLVNICIQIHGKRKFITVFTTKAPSWAKQTCIRPFWNTSLFSILISLFCLCLGPPFRRFRKIVKSDSHVCLPSVRPSVCPFARNNSASTGRIFMEIDV